ncbi:MAG: hypothetical protein K8953_09060, partial [Proteobacteria bacterium]|nr:hypothetical protein [Pseudomonadota bacterium]
ASYQVFEDYLEARVVGVAANNRDGLEIFDNIIITNRGGGNGGTETGASTLLKGTATGLVQTGPGIFPACAVGQTQRCGTIITSQTIRLGENPRSSSGFVIMDLSTVGAPRRDTYFGLLSGTNLGAILPVRFGGGATKAIWHGSLYTNAELIERDDERGFVNLIHYPLSLTVDLAAGTLQTVNLLGNLGAVALTPTSSITIDGRFGLNARTAKVPYGILRGDVNYNTLNYTLVGLIGVEGAIGIFRDPTYQGAGLTGGGFQVSPPPPPAYGRGNYAVFEDFYHRSKSSTDDLYLAGSITAGTDQFVRGTPTGLVKHNLTGDLEAGSFAPLTVYLGGDVNSGNAFVLESFNGTHVAGLLSTTDLGFAPHENLASATWLGTFYVSNNVASTGTDGPAPFVIKSGVKVDFAAGTLTSTQEIYTLANNQFISFGIYGRFGERQHELPLGIL